MRALPLDLIDPNPQQARRQFAAIDELAESFRRHGLLEPIVVRPVARRYEIIAGERRWRAAKVAGWATIEAVVRQATPEQAYEWGLVENVQRESLSPIEEAEAYQRLQAEGRTQKKIGVLVGKTQSYVSHKLRLLTLPAIT